MLMIGERLPGKVVDFDIIHVSEGWLRLQITLKLRRPESLTVRREAVKQHIPVIRKFLKQRIKSNGASTITFSPPPFPFFPQLCEGKVAQARKERERKRKKSRQHQISPLFMSHA